MTEPIEQPVNEPVSAESAEARGVRCSRPNWIVNVRPFCWGIGEFLVKARWA